jgi:hypothetical protein
MRTLTSLIGLLVFCVQALPQEQQSLYWQNWYLPDAISIAFPNAQAPIVELDSCPTSLSGFSYTVSNAANGQVEFSISNDAALLDRFGDPIIGGTSFYDVQSTWVIPHPGDASQYYLFQTGFNTTYSLLDLDQNGGTPAFVMGQYQVPFATGMALGCAILSDPDGIDHWLSLYHMADSSFHVFNVNAGLGLSTTPVIQSAGQALPTNVVFKASPDNSRLAALSGIDEVVLFSVDPEAGTINASLPVLVPGGSTFAAEFSPNSQVLYVYRDINPDSAHWLQFDLSQWDALAISNSVVRLDLIGTSAAGFVGMQLAPDGHIYSTLDGGPPADPQYFQGHLVVIRTPNTLGMGCQLDTVGFDLQRTCTLVPFLPKVHWFATPLSALEEWARPAVQGPPSIRLIVGPNPVVNDFMVEVDHSLTSRALVELVAPTGQVAWSANWKGGFSNRFTIPDLAVGTYTLKVTAPDGSIGKSRIVVMR